MKKVYIAHPISGNVEENIRDILRILSIINTNSHPFKDWSMVAAYAPYCVDCLSLDDSNPFQRKKGIENNRLLIDSMFFDELWLTGNFISSGMEDEKNIFLSLKLPVINRINKF